MSDNPWEQIGDWSDELPICSADVMQHWWRLLAREDPWRAMSADDRHGSMRTVVTELLNEARDPHGEERIRRLTSAARIHGVFRWAQRCEADALSCEFGLLLAGLEFALFEAGLPERTVTDALTILDPDVVKAEVAAMLGWSRAESADPRRLGVPWAIDAR